MRGEPDRDLVARLRGLRPALEARGIRHRASFGSRARGTQRPDSDIDLLVDVALGSRFSLIDLVMRRSPAPAFSVGVADQETDPL